MSLTFLDRSILEILLFERDKERRKTLFVRFISVILLLSAYNVLSLLLFERFNSVNRFESNVKLTNYLLFVTLISLRMHFFIENVVILVFLERSI